MKINHSAGFTMIEMMLAMAFVSFLMVAIAMTTISIGRTYTKGITMTQVNEAGRTIAADMQRTIANAPPQNGMRDSNNAYCFGSYSYVWNDGEDIFAAETSPTSNLIEYSTGETVRLAKVLDPNAVHCPEDPNDAPGTVTGGVELLPPGDRNLAIQALEVTQLGMSPTQAMYNVEFTLGTNDQEALTSNNQSCQPPSELTNDVNYCAVNTFDLLVRAGGGE